MNTKTIRRTLFAVFMLILLFEIITGGGIVIIRLCNYLCPHVDIQQGMVTLQPDFKTINSVRSIHLISYNIISRKEANLFLHFNIDKERVKDESIHFTINSVHLDNRIIDEFSGYEFTINASHPYVRPVTKKPLDMSAPPRLLIIDGTYTLLSNNETHEFHEELRIDVKKEKTELALCWEIWFQYLNQ